MSEMQFVTLHLPHFVWDAIREQIDAEYPGFLRYQATDIARGNFAFLGIKFVLKKEEQAA